MRGKSEGDGDVAMSSSVRVNRTVEASFSMAHASSNTLQSGDRLCTEARRARLIEATVEAIAAGNDPRLAETLAHA